MKRITSILIVLLTCSSSLMAQEYAKYTTKKAKDTVFAEPQKTPVVNEKAWVEPQEVKNKETKSFGDFQAIMNKAGEQTIQNNYREALKFYTQALEVSPESESWRVYISRATSYYQLKEYKKAIKEYTLMIEDSNTPQKEVAYAYLMRANVVAETGTKKEKANACDDLKKAKELGIDDMVIKTQQVYALKCR